MAYAVNENKVAELKSRTKTKREERERDETMKMEEEKRRRGLIKEAYLQWMLKSEEEGISVAEVWQAQWAILECKPSVWLCNAYSYRRLQSLSTLHFEAPTYK